jgi:hypothetical protein
MNAMYPDVLDGQLDLFTEIETAQHEQLAEQAPGLFDLDQVGYFLRLEITEQWRRTYGAARRIRDAHAWAPCISQMRREQVPAAQCRPAIMVADLRCEHYDVDCYCPGDLLYRGECLACPWEGPAHDRHNPAVEDAHDHAWAGWRTLPAASRRPEPGTTHKLKAAMARWVDGVNEAYPEGWLEAGGPIRTLRGESGTRHVPGHSGFGGYDLAIRDQP